MDKAKKEAADDVFVPADKIETRNVAWLTEGFLPIGSVTVLAGEAGLGKSQIAIDLIAAVTRGHFWPTKSKNATMKGRVLLASLEDAHESTTKPRLRAARAKLSRVAILKQSESEKPEAGLLAAVQAHLKTATKVKLLVVDTLTALGLSAKGQVALLASLHKIAETHSLAVLVITHLNKSAYGTMLKKVHGSFALTAMARSVLGVTRSDDGERELQILKANLGRDSRAYRFKIITKMVEEKVKTSKVKWLGMVEPTRVHSTNRSNQVVKALLLGKERVDSKEFAAAAKELEVPLSRAKKEAKKLGFNRERVGGLAADGKWQLVRKLAMTKQSPPTPKDGAENW